MTGSGIEIKCAVLIAANRNFRPLRWNHCGLGNLPMNYRPRAARGVRWMAAPDAPALGPFFAKEKPAD